MCPDEEMDPHGASMEYFVLETTEGALDCFQAVKKYRRSAETGEAPLPEDYRPPEVLVCTMH